MKNYLFELIESSIVNQTHSELCDLGVQDIYVIEDDEEKKIFIGGRSTKTITHTNLIPRPCNDTVDWEEQWATFAQDFHDGKSHIDLSKYGKNTNLILYPGHGFGDLSHPTTNLMLEMMKEKIQGKTILDIGSGSGILSLAAVLLGAVFAHGIDIDNQALIHSRKNAKLNKLKNHTKFSKKLPPKIDHQCVCLMNMIYPEQIKFNPSKIQQKNCLWITSGILQEQKDLYIHTTKEWGWTLLEEYCLQNWMGFVFKSSE